MLGCKPQPDCCELIFTSRPAGDFLTSWPGKVSAAAVTPVMHDQNSTEKVITSSIFNGDTKNLSGNNLLEAPGLNRLGDLFWRHNIKDLSA